MKSRLLSGLFAALVLTAASGVENNFDDALKRAAIDYADRLRQAGDELNRTRERIAREKAPLLEELRAVESRISALERETGRLGTDQEQVAANKRRLLQFEFLFSRRNTGSCIARAVAFLFRHPERSEGSTPASEARADPVDPSLCSG
ncbi:MAG: hypothetical protein WDM96_14640 [Lacunisphaera sp.]